MFHLLKKDSLLLLRSRSDLTELLFMPFILIAILGLALGNLTMTEFNINAFPVGFVQENAEESLEAFQDDLRSRQLPEEAVVQMVSQAESVVPSEQLNEVLISDEIAEWVDLKSYTSLSEGTRALEDGEITGLITVPEGFNEAVWAALFLDEPNTLALRLDVQDSTTVTTDIVRSVLTTYADQFNLEASVALATEGQADILESPDNYGSLETLTREDPINSFQYYTIGMGVMFALHTAPALSTRAFKEKQQHVYGRLMLSGTRPYTYLTSKMAAGTLITLIQLILLFGLSTLIFGTFRGRSALFWGDVFLVSAVFSLVVGSITSLLTSMTLYSKSNAASGFFGGIVVTIFAFVGGSFTPVENFSQLLREIGNWTPNGAMMTVYLQLLQGFTLSEVLSLLVRVLAMTVIVLAVSLVLFPKRRLD